MPHDRNGNELKAGDVVTFRARVLEVYPQEDGLGVFEILDVGEVGEFGPTVTCNTRLCGAFRLPDGRDLELTTPGEAAAEQVSR
jgi:hypothetical protein